jgi:hypothetical protein
MSADMTPEQSSVVAVRFLIDAECAPGMLPRLLQPFARRDLVPDRMWSHRSGETMHVEIAVEAMAVGMVHLVEGNLAQTIGVRGVTRVERAYLRQVA